MNQKLRKYLYYLEFILVTGFYLVFIYIFITAYSTPEKAVIVYINRYHEGFVELIFTIISIILFPWFFWVSVKTNLKQKH